MKRLLKLCVFALLAVFSITICSCDHSESTPTPQQEKKADTATVASQVETIVNPTFNVVEDVVLFQGMLQEEFFIDTEFREMPVDILRNVSKVVISRNKQATKRDIVVEYQSRKDVYDNLTQGKAGDEVSPTVMEEQQLPAPKNVSYHYEIDTIDGKATKVLVKEERYETK